MGRPLIRPRRLPQTLPPVRSRRSTCWEPHYGAQFNLLGAEFLKLKLCPIYLISASQMHLQFTCIWMAKLKLSTNYYSQIQKPTREMSNLVIIIPYDDTCLLATINAWRQPLDFPLTPDTLLRLNLCSNGEGRKSKCAQSSQEDDWRSSKNRVLGGDLFTCRFWWERFPRKSQRVVSERQLLLHQDVRRKPLSTSAGEYIADSLPQFSFGRTICREVWSLPCDARSKQKCSKVSPLKDHSSLEPVKGLRLEEW